LKPSKALLIAAMLVSCTHEEARAPPRRVGRAQGWKPVAPAKGTIVVAFVVTEGANVMDLAGAWEVFQDVTVESRGSSMDDQMPFRLYTVSDTRSPVRMTGGMQVIPSYTFDDAPPPGEEPRPGKLTQRRMGASASRGPWRGLPARARFEGMDTRPELARLNHQVEFIVEVDRLKEVLRQNVLTVSRRRENDAEHSWHLCLCVLVLAEHADAPQVDLLTALPS
jgi:HD domain